MLAALDAPACRVARLRSSTDRTATTPSSLTKRARGIAPGPVFARRREVDRLRHCHRRVVGWNAAQAPQKAVWVCSMGSRRAPPVQGARRSPPFNVPAASGLLVLEARRSSVEGQGFSALGHGPKGRPALGVVAPQDQRGITLVHEFGDLERPLPFHQCAEREGYARVRSGRPVARSEATGNMASDSEEHRRGSGMVSLNGVYCRL